jgi:hypothetical protein
MEIEGRVRETYKKKLCVHECRLRKKERTRKTTISFRQIEIGFEK